MNFVETNLEGAYIIELEKIHDERGFFARTWDSEIFAKKNLDSKLTQSSISFNNKRGTLRGMHFQLPPYEETKLVRCTRGKIFDVIIDLRKNSSTYLKWTSIELSSDNYKLLYVPKGFAHGFQTLTDHAEVSYQISEKYSQKHASGVLWNDPIFNIKWPIPDPIISKKDTEWNAIRD